MKEPVEMIQSLCDLVSDMFVGTHFTARICLSLEINRLFVASQICPDCPQMAMPRLVGSNEDYLLDDVSHWNGDNQLKRPACVYPTAVRSKKLRE